MNFIITTKCAPAALQANWSITANMSDKIIALITTTRCYMPTPSTITRKVVTKERVSWLSSATGHTAVLFKQPSPTASMCFYSVRSTATARCVVTSWENHSITTYKVIQVMKCIITTRYTIILRTKYFIAVHKIIFIVGSTATTRCCIIPFRCNICECRYYMIHCHNN